jgi:hypothetical protein
MTSEQAEAMAASVGRKIFIDGEECHILSNSAVLALVNAVADVEREECAKVAAAERTILIGRAARAENEFDRALHNYGAATCGICVAAIRARGQS